MLNDPAKQLAASVAAPVFFALGVDFLPRIIGAKDPHAKATKKCRGSNIVSNGSRALAYISYAAAGYASFRIYLRSSLFGPPMTGTPKALTRKANATLMSYAVAVFGCAMWNRIFNKSIKASIASSVTSHVASLAAMFNSLKMDMVAGLCFIPISIISTMTAIFSVSSWKSPDGRAVVCKMAKKVMGKCESAKESTEQRIE